MQLATSGRPGPVHIQISNAAAAQPVHTRQAAYAPPLPAAPANCTAARAECIGRLEPALAELATAACATAADWGDARVAQYRAALAGRELPAPAPTA